MYFFKHNGANATFSLLSNSRLIVKSVIIKIKNKWVLVEQKKSKLAALSV